jgi:hypothetical protein
MTHPHTLYIGLDVHQEAIAVAYVAHDHGAEVPSLGTMGTRPCDLDHLVRTRPSKAKPLVLVSAAGPCGSWLSRDVTTKGYQCWVVAPSWLPKQAGDRVNTDRRAAGHLARLRRSGALTPVDVPTVADEASRDRQRRLEPLPNAVQEISWTAPGRLRTRSRTLRARGKHAHPVVVAIARDLIALMGAMANEVPVIPSKAPIVLEQRSSASHRKGARPRDGVTRDGVTRPAGIRVPRVRQAPDRPTSGGSQPPEISVINRRVFLAPPLPMDSVKSWALVMKTSNIANTP